MTSILFLAVFFLLLLAALMLVLSWLLGNKNKKQDTVQDLMPVADIQGCWAFLKDGSYRAYMAWPGRNQSLDTEQERAAKALCDAEVISAIDVKFAIFKYPECINSSHQLNLVDKAIEREQQAFYDSQTELERMLHKSNLQYLTDFLREEALSESYGDDRVSWTSAIGICFPAGHDMDLAQEMLDNVLRIAAEVVENPPRLMNEREIRHLYQLYFTPDSVADIAAPAGNAVLPDYGDILGANPKASNSKKAQTGKKTEVNPYVVSSICPSMLRFQEGYGICGEELVRPYNLTKFPFRENIGWTRRLFSKHLKAPVVLVAEPLRGAALDKQINRTVLMAEPQAGDGMLTYTERAAKQQQAENAMQLNNMIMNDNTAMFDVTMYMVLRAEMRQDLSRAKDFARDLAGNGPRCSIEKLWSNTQDSFMAASPAVLSDKAGEDAYATPMPADTIALGEMFFTDGYDDQEGIALGVSKLGGNVRLNMHMHTDERPNGNILFVAPSGHGKSTAMKHIAKLESLLYDTTFIQLNDIENEYGEMALQCGGEISDPIGKLSPFEPRNIATTSTDTDDGSEELARYYEQALQERVLSNHIPFLKTFLQLAFPLIDKERASFLGRPLTAVYKKYGITKDTTFAEYFAGPQKFPTMKDLYYELRKEAREANKKEEERDRAKALSLIAQAIEDVAIGYDDDSWNSQESFTVNSKFVVINTSRLSDDETIKAAQLYNILMWSWSQIRSNRFGSSYTRVALDELGSIFDTKNSLAKQQISEMVRRARKYNAGVMFAVQGINSLIGDPDDEKIGSTLLDNCTYKFFGSAGGNQPGCNLYEVQHYLSLTNQLRDELGQAAKKNFILTIGKHDKTWVEINAIQPWELELFGKGGGK